MTGLIMPPKEFCIVSFHHCRACILRPSLLYIGNNDILCVYYSSILVCPVAGCVSDVLVIQKPHMLWHSFSGGTLVNQLDGKKISGQSTSKKSSYLSLVILGCYLYPLCSSFLHHPLTGGHYFCCSVVPVYNWTGWNTFHLHHRTNIYQVLQLDLLNSIRQTSLLLLAFLLHIGWPVVQSLGLEGFFSFGPFMFHVIWP